MSAYAVVCMSGRRCLALLQLTLLLLMLLMLLILLILQRAASLTIVCFHQAGFD